MSSNRSPLPRQAVLPYALRLWDRITPVCTASCYAGSLRRHAPEVNDIEIVAQPSDPDALSLVLTSMLESGWLQWDEEVKRQKGDRYKRFILPALADSVSPGFAVDLFLTTPENYGNILMIRTGNADWSHAMMTPLRRGGLRPPHVRCDKGFVWQQDRDRQAIVLPIPTEAALFAAWGLPFVAPADRHQETVHAIRRSLGLPYISIARTESAPAAAPEHHRLEAFA